jgi:hypothetical protein
MSGHLQCAELQRLKQEYQRTLRVWAHYAFRPPTDELLSLWRLDQLKYESQLARDIAAKHLSAHQEDCLLCRYG